MAVVTRLELKGRNGLDKYDKYPIAVNIPVSLNYNLADVRNPDQRKASFSKTINLNGTNEINKLFENIFSVNVATQYFNKNLKTPVRYIVNEIENFSGDLQLIKININPDNSIVYECSIVGAGGSLFIDIGEKYITGNANTSDDLDFSAYDHNYTRANQIASRTTYLGTGTGYVYPFVDRGTNGNNDVVWNVKDFLPCFSIYEYITKIIAATGRTFTSTFLNTAEFKKLICYPNITKVDLTQAQLENQQFYVGLTTNVTQASFTGGFVKLTYNNETGPFFDDGSQNNTTTGLVTINESGYYNIVAKVLYRIKFTHSDPNVASMSFGNGGINNRIRKVVGTNDFDITANADYFTNLGTFTHPINGLIPVNTFVTTPINEVATGEILLNAGDVIYNGQKVLNLFSALNIFRNAAGTIITPTGTATFTVEALSGINGCAFYGLVSRKEVVEGNPLQTNKALPTNIKQKDFFKSVIQAFNLYVDVDKNNENNLIIETFDEFYNADIVDYENRTDTAKEQSINPNLLEGKRYIYTYKSDADYFNDLYQKTWNETYGTEQIDVENDFIKSDKKNELIFSGTPNAANYGMSIAHPRIYKLDGTDKKTIASNIRMLYCAVKTSPNAYTYKQIGQTDLVTNDYLYAGMEDDPFNPTVSLMFGPPKEVYYNYVNSYFTTNNLYNRYHRNYLKNLINKDAKFVTKYLWLNEKDIYLFNFRNRLFIDGAYYIVNKIENYNPLELTSTKVELVKLLDTDVFTPESININDNTAVNAGTDVQNYRLNSSLNVGTNIQNRGTNCLAVGNNIVIPASCSNLIVFGSNITADENSTGLLLNYKSYVALISQTGTAAPTVTILENTIGDIVWTRFAAGDYRGTLTDAFTSGKVITLSNQIEPLQTILIVRKNIDSIAINTITTSTGAAIDSALVNTSIEIRVYN
jgi:hypothetical protein